MKRKTKYVVWLYNHTDSRDDDWKSIWADNPKEAFKNVEYDSFRFSKGPVRTATQFRKEFGITAH